MSALTEQEMEGLNPGESPDYATRLRDEVAMRAACEAIKEMWGKYEADIILAKGAVNFGHTFAEAFMSERKRREGSK